MFRKYKNSEDMLSRALKTIPLGSQTFSKSKTQFPYGVSPYFIEKGKGSRIWDVDGNEYIDFINSLAAITLGYNDTDVVNAVKEQLENGTIFSLPHPIEHQSAEKMIEIIPCAEMVRFGKNGSDATSGAIRLARAYTKRDKIAVCGYHGWQDWYIGSTTRDLGVPQAVKDLTHKFTYNDIESLHKLFKDYPDQFAAVIMEPMNTCAPQNNFLHEVKELTHKNNALFILDEMITGFRFSNGGAQEYFGITPDLATFGKGMANGYPISAVTGKADIMKLIEEIFFSTTFGGETLSLAASLATMTKYQKEPVIEKLKTQGQKVKDGIGNIIQENNAHDLFSVTGHPSWSFFVIEDTPDFSKWEIKTLYLQEMFKRGVLTLGTHNLSYAHNDEDIKTLLEAYNEIIPLIQSAVKEKNLHQILKAEVLRPLFTVR